MTDPVRTVVPDAPDGKSKREHVRTVRRITSHHFDDLGQAFDSHGISKNVSNPSGGHTYGPGLCVAWQHGPLKSNGAEKPPNGAFVEDLIDAAADRLDYFQSTRFACTENALAVEYLQKARAVLEARTARREHQCVAGTHEA